MQKTPHEWKDGTRVEVGAAQEEGRKWEKKNRQGHLDLVGRNFALVPVHCLSDRVQWKQLGGLVSSRTDVLAAVRYRYRLSVRLWGKPPLTDISNRGARSECGARGEIRVALEWLFSALTVKMRRAGRQARRTLHSSAQFTKQAK